MYGVEFELDEKVLDKDFVIPIGKAKIQRSGKLLFSTAVYSYIYKKENMLQLLHSLEESAWPLKQLRLLLKKELNLRYVLCEES